MSAKLYKCEGFSEDCWLENKCICKSTFNPMHIWKENRYMIRKIRNRDTLVVKCDRDGEDKEVRSCQ